MIVMKTALRFFVLLVISLLLGGIILVRHSHIPETALRVAVKENEISDVRYVLAKRERITGFDWRLVKNEYGERSNELFNITGLSPFDEFSFRHEFVMANNTFVFYIEEKKLYFSNEIMQNAIEYSVSGWDILYPVKRHDFPYIFRSRKAILENDLIK